MTLWIFTSLSSSVAADTASCVYKEQSITSLSGLIITAGRVPPTFLFSSFIFGSASVMARLIRYLLLVCTSPAVSGKLSTMQWPHFEQHLKRSWNFQHCSVVLYWPSSRAYVLCTFVPFTMQNSYANLPSLIYSQQKCPSSIAVVLTENRS